ncbi:hypothetical protein CEXT_87161 [Caerostris extrusa]|uniref:Uncharacterized protein n=1 Tax=Caerostris extrusa TaxID=172846 RepID=A0AAV4T8N1_CAEEX|nr:hypothetical protein CEXT_87161 [Caerostris extrusa]
MLFLYYLWHFLNSIRTNGTQKTQISTCEDDAFDCHMTISKTRAISIYLTDSIFAHRPAYWRGAILPKVFQRGRSAGVVPGSVPNDPAIPGSESSIRGKGEINAPQDKRCNSLIKPETLPSPLSKTIGRAALVNQTLW